jgi:heme-degrading monooxygenase HmoA
MINIGLYYKVKPGFESQFEDTFLNVVSLLKSSDFGFLEGKLYRQIGVPREYMLYTEWEGLDSFRKFMESKEYAKTVEFGRTIIEGQPRHKVFQG